MIAEKIAAVLNGRRAEAIAGDGHKAAAVLVPIQECPDGDYLVLTKRTDGLPTHKGQIVFPGGRVHAADADAIATALRESDGNRRGSFGAHRYPDETRQLHRRRWSLARRPPDLSFLHQWLGCLGRDGADHRAVFGTGL